MKKTLVLACALALAALAALAGFAQAPLPHQVTLAEIMAPAVAAQNQPTFLASRRHQPGGITPKVLCQADCGGTTVSCQSSSAGTCVAVDQSCPNTQGYVSCDGATTYCPACSGTQICTPGSLLYLPWDGVTCCGEGGKYQEQLKCSDDGTYWYSTGGYSCRGFCGGA